MPQDSMKEAFDVLHRVEAGREVSNVEANSAQYILWINGYHAEANSIVSKHEYFVENDPMRPGDGSGSGISHSDES